MGANGIGRHDVSKNNYSDCRMEVAEQVWVDVRKPLEKQPSAKR